MQAVTSGCPKLASYCWPVGCGLVLPRNVPNPVLGSVLLSLWCRRPKLTVALKGWGVLTSASHCSLYPVWAPERPHCSHGDREKERAGAGLLLTSWPWTSLCYERPGPTCEILGGLLIPARATGPPQTEKWETVKNRSAPFCRTPWISHPEGLIAASWWRCHSQEDRPAFLSRFLSSQLTGISNADFLWVQQE